VQRLPPARSGTRSRRRRRAGDPSGGWHPN
jgi:hypothetical protein